MGWCSEDVASFFKAGARASEGLEKSIASQAVSADYKILL